MQFERLSHFVPHLVDTSVKKNWKYVMGLSMTIQGNVEGSLDKTSELILGLAATLEMMRGSLQQQSKPMGFRLGHPYSRNGPSSNQGSGAKRL